MKKKLILILLSISLIGTVFVSCGSNKNEQSNNTSQEQEKEINIDEIINTITKDVEMRNTQTITDTEAKEIFKLDLDKIDSYSIEKGSMNTGLETIAIIKAKKGQVENVKASLEAYKNSIQPFYPGEQEAIDSAKLIVKGDYLGFFIIPDYEDGQGNIDKVTNTFENFFKWKLFN